MGAKYIRGIRLDADSANVSVNVAIQTDGGVTGATVAATHNGRSEIAYPFATPFLAYETRLVPAAGIRIFGYELILDEYPDLKSLITPWTDSGVSGPKHIRAITLEADTGNAPISINLQTDEGVVSATFIATHNGKSKHTYAFATPFTVYETRLVPAGDIRIFGYEFTQDPYPDLKPVLSEWTDSGFPGPKYVRAIMIEADTANAIVSCDIQIDGGTVGGSISAQHNGRTEVTYPFAVPFIAYETRIVPSANIRLFGYKLIADEYPDLKAVLSAIGDDGYPGDKYIRGVVIEADTGGVAASVGILADGVLVETLSLTASGRRLLDFSFATPFIARELQLVPAAAVRLFKTRWDYDRYPELNRLITSIIDAGKRGDKYIRGLLIEVDTGNAPATIDVVGDGAVQTTLAVTANGKSDKDFVFSTPFISREIQLIPKTGNVRIFSEPRWYFDDYPELNRLLGAISNLGKPGDKYFRGVLLEVDTGGAPATIDVVGDGAIKATLSVTATGRSEKDFTFTPFIAREVQLVPATGSVRIFGSGTWTFDPYPELNRLVTSIIDAEKRGDKYIRGLLLEVDTDNAPATIDLVGDGTVLTTLSVTANGKSDKDFVFSSPFIAREVQFIPKTGNVRIFGQPKWYFDDYPELNRLLTAITNQGKPGDKHFRSVILEMDTGNAPASINVLGDGAIAATLTATANGRREKDFVFDPPFIAREIQLAPVSGNVRLFGPGSWTFDDYPELNAAITEWTDGGHSGAKFVQGMLLEADSGNSPVVIEVEGDEGVLGATVTATHNGRSEKAYPGSSSDVWIPFVAHKLRLVPQSGVRIFGVRFVFEPEPESAILWETQPTTHDIDGFGHLYRMQVPHKSTANVTLTVTIDGADYTYTIPHGSGAYVKSFVTLKAIKGRSFTYKFSSPQPFRLYRKDVNVDVKQWGATGPYGNALPFGGLSRESGALI